MCFASTLILYYIVNSYFLGRFISTVLSLELIFNVFLRIYSDRFDREAFKTCQSQEKLHYVSAECQILCQKSLILFKSLLIFKVKLFKCGYRFDIQFLQSLFLKKGAPLLLRRLNCGRVALVNAICGKDYGANVLQRVQILLVLDHQILHHIGKGICRNHLRFWIGVDLRFPLVE